MSLEHLRFSTPDFAKLVVRTILEEDIELLRTWKNAHRDRFFFKEIIAQEMQKEWFQSYLHREHDFMFVVIYDNERVGCLGFRRHEDRVDFYNVILDEGSARKGYMSRALDLLCDEATLRYPEVPIMASVLRANPDLPWYFRRGFIVTSEHETFLELTRNLHRGPDSATPVPGDLALGKRL